MEFRRNFHAATPQPFLLPLLAVVPIAVPAVYFGRKYLQQQQELARVQKEDAWQRLQGERLQDTQAPIEIGNAVLDVGTTLFKMATSDISSLQVIDCPSLQSLGSTSHSLDVHEVSRFLTRKVSQARAELPKGRVIFTIPSKTDIAVRVKNQILESVEAKGAVFVPDAVAAVWGAQAAGLLSIPHPSPSLIVNIGGRSTSLCVVARDRVLSSTMLLILYKYLAHAPTVEIIVIVYSLSIFEVTITLYDLN